jgi:hypothetical protein
MDPYFDLDKNVNFYKVYKQLLDDVSRQKLILRKNGDDQDILATIKTKIGQNVSNTNTLEVFKNSLSNLKLDSILGDKEWESIRRLYGEYTGKEDDDYYKRLFIPYLYSYLISNNIPKDKLLLFQIILYSCQNIGAELLQSVPYNVIPSNTYFSNIFYTPGQFKKENFTGTNLDGDYPSLETIIYPPTSSDSIKQTSTCVFQLIYDYGSDSQYGLAKVHATCYIDYADDNNDVKFLWKIDWRNDAVKKFMEMIKELHDKDRGVDEPVLRLMCSILFQPDKENTQQDIVNVFEGICVKYSGNTTRLERLTNFKEHISKPDTNVQELLTKYQKDYPYKLSDPHISELISRNLNKVGDYIESGICGQVAKCPEISDKKENGSDTDTDTDSDEESSQDNALPKNNDTRKQPYDAGSSELNWVRKEDGRGWTSEQEPRPNFKLPPPSSVPPPPPPVPSSSSPPQSQQPLVTQSTEVSDVCLKNEEARACKERLLQRKINSIKSTLNKYENNEQYNSMMTNINNINVADVAKSEVKIKQINDIINLSNSPDDKIARINSLFRQS